MSGQVIIFLGVGVNERPFSPAEETQFGPCQLVGAELGRSNALVWETLGLTPGGHGVLGALPLAPDPWLSVGLGGGLRGGHQRELTLQHKLQLTKTSWGNWR